MRLRPVSLRWLSGEQAPREFLYVDDLADACLFLMNHYSGNETVNLGTGKELSIAGLAGLWAGQWVIRAK